jgi:GcrA cell cycle regulator
MSWTDERVELLRQLWLDGRSASQISAQLGHGVTRNAVIGKVHRLGLAGRAKAPAAAPAPRPAPQRSAPRLGGGGGGGGARAATRGATALAMVSEPALDTRPVFREEDVVVPMSLRVTIVELKEAMCRWPLGDPTSPDFRYCGSPSPGIGPYCVHHGKLAYQPLQDRRRERDRERRALLR